MGHTRTTLRTDTARWFDHYLKGIDREQPVRLKSRSAGGYEGQGALDQLAQLPPDAQHVRGTAALHTTVTATKESGTPVAYLYDVGPLGLGKLVGHAPYTFHGQTPGKPFGVDPELFSTAYNVPAGHRLALVVDTVDPLCIEHNPTGAQLTFSSPEHDPS